MGVNVNEIKQSASKIIENVSKVIVGKDDVLKLVVTAFLSGGHVLLEDIPGLGKTVLAKSLAKTIDCEFRRIQFTPDLLPSDLSGINYYNQKAGDFEFKKGPIFANIVLADEINRATPRTQSSLLECMEEKQISIDGVTTKLEDPFFVIATQNPIETQGTFPLPEAQLDRFAVKISMGYPDKNDGMKILNRFIENSPIEELQAVVGKEDVAEISRGYGFVKVSEDIKEYIMDIVEATRTSDRLLMGVSPRGSLSLMKMAQIYAAIDGRDYVVPADVKTLCVPVLAHRVILSDQSYLSQKIDGGKEIIESIVEKIKVPIEN